jgi:aspartate aminotransferase-like enzyme
VTTPALPVLYALDRQLDVILEESMEARWERHLGLQAMTAKWARGREHRYASQEGARSPTVSCLKPPARLPAPQLVSALADRGIVVGGGYGAWKPETFRIGHMGEVRGRDLEMLFETIDEIVASH